MASFDKIVCVGKNYVEHAKELGDAVPEKPVLFLKPPSALKSAVAWGATLEARLPEGRGDVHHECEIVLKLGALDSNGSPAIEAVTLGLDMTLRSLQSTLKKQGHPWEISKVFADSAIIGPWIPAAEFRKYLEEPFELRINGALRQQGRGSQMSFDPDRILAHAREHFPLLPGDLVFTGTPAGVGEVRDGDLAELSWGERAFSVRFAARAADRLPRTRLE